MCKNLENLCLRLNLDEDKMSFYDYCRAKGNPSENFKIKALENLDDSEQIRLPKLKSIVLVKSSRNRTEANSNQIDRFIQTIVRQSRDNLQCFWTSLPFSEVSCIPPHLYVPFNLKEMIAWKETKSIKMPLVLEPTPAMESLACNKYMERGEFHSTRFKQIECGFWKDVIPLKSVWSL